MSSTEDLEKNITLENLKENMNSEDLKRNNSEYLKSHLYGIVKEKQGERDFHISKYINDTILPLIGDHVFKNKYTYEEFIKDHTNYINQDHTNYINHDYYSEPFLLGDRDDKKSLAYMLIKHEDIKNLLFNYDKYMYYCNGKNTNEPTYYRGELIDSKPIILSLIEKYKQVLAVGLYKNDNKNNIGPLFTEGYTNELETMKNYGAGDLFSNYGADTLDKEVSALDKKVSALDKEVSALDAEVRNDLGGVSLDKVLTEVDNLDVPLYDVLPEVFKPNPDVQEKGKKTIYSFDTKKFCGETKQDLEKKAKKNKETKSKEGSWFEILKDLKKNFQYKNDTSSDDAFYTELFNFIISDKLNNQYILHFYIKDLMKRTVQQDLLSHDHDNIIVRMFDPDHNVEDKNLTIILNEFIAKKENIIEKNDMPKLKAELERNSVIISENIKKYMLKMLNKMIKDEKKKLLKKKPPKKTIG